MGGFSAALQPGRHAGKKHKAGRTIMRDPPRKIKEGSCCREIQRVIRIRFPVKIVTCMVKRHNHYDNATQQIDGWYPVFSTRVYCKRQWPDGVTGC